MLKLNPTDSASKQKTAAMFAKIAPRYRLLNRVMTFGRDQRWRKAAAARLEATPGDVILDLGAGSGDLALEIRERYPEVKVIACDLTLQMVQIGRQRPKGETIMWVLADGEHLPFADGSMTGIISGFLLRNLLDLPRSLKEQWRALREGGKFISLDTTRPMKNIFYPAIRLYLEWIIPLLGRILAGERGAYAYLTRSTQNFLTAEALEQEISAVGFSRVQFVRRMFGVIAIHTAIKPVHLKKADHGQSG